MCCNNTCVTNVNNVCDTKNENKLSTNARFIMSNKRKNVTLICFLIIGFVLVAMKPFEKNEAVKDVLYSSIAWVESKGNPNAKSKDGSVGIIQIKPVMVKEVNRICKIRGLKKQFTLSDRHNPKKSEEMFWIYQKFYNPNMNWDSISTADIKVMARKWNGGPNGDLKRATYKYWKKVSKRFNVELDNRNITMISKL